MASLIFNSLLDDQARGAVNFGSDSFKAMLVTSAYTPDKDAHTKRSNVTNEVTGTGYTAGGASVTATPALDLTNDRENITFSNPSWANATITARGLVIYKSRGGAATADELVAYVDFGADVTSTGGTFSATFTAPLRYQN
jgi:hypothetical protein